MIAGFWSNEIAGIPSDNPIECGCRQRVIKRTREIEMQNPHCLHDDKAEFLLN